MCYKSDRGERTGKREWQREGRQMASVTGRKGNKKLPTKNNY